MKAILFLICAALSVSGQYQLERSTVVIGGAQVSGGSYGGTTTIGQPAVGGFLTGASLTHYTGFWSPELAPTAAGVSISGRVLASNGAGLMNATVYLLRPNGEILAARTSSLGYYQFDDIEVGQTVIISVTSKRYMYLARTVSVHDSLTDFDFSPLKDGVSRDTKVDLGPC
jgi:hypothetical protein